MNTNFSDLRDEAPSIEMRVYRDGELVTRELCESEDEALLTVDTWTELEGVTCEVDDLSGRAVGSGPVGPSALLTTSRNRHAAMAGSRPAQQGRTA